MIDPFDMDKHDKQFLLGAILSPLIVWWLLSGRKKYSTKGMN